MKPMPNPKCGAVQVLVDSQIAISEGVLKDLQARRESFKKSLEAVEAEIAQTSSTLAELRAYKP